MAGYCRIWWTFSCVNQIVSIVPFPDGCILGQQHLGYKVQNHQYLPQVYRLSRHDYFCSREKTRSCPRLVLCDGNRSIWKSSDRLWGLRRHLAGLHATIQGQTQARPSCCTQNPSAKGNVQDWGRGSATGSYLSVTSYMPMTLLQIGSGAVQRGCPLENGEPS